MTPEQLEELANENFSSFEGEENFDGYDGFNDDMLDFGGAGRKTFAQSINSSRVFTYNIKNTTSDDVYVVLNPAYHGVSTPDAVVLKQGLTEIAGGLGIVGTGSPKSIDNLIAFIRNNPALLRGFKVKAKNDASSLEQILTVKEFSPFRDLESREIALSVYQDEHTYQEKVVTVPEEIYMSNQTELTILVKGGEELTITWLFDTILNNAAALKQKHQRAKSNVRRGTAGLKRKATVAANRLKR
jgi:hypothetical protein